ncbi:MAG: tRNA (adenosine(37)-N6)-threonylcarbamoyltransferase complex dimerization subunit type 1 TsaB [Gemmataceae bacterium]|nr:tRNA (adenosine(37)-N6)-threonylcarbamoyltransferase complex dimerization subunit type 1 TsaB [Gemmataceae bacterium]MDW8265345.1 tRNA (adenosine(37)-N6)-threonylcarbamoyltransferase complex dimerization subunit type 1 TsaB [Gemmataceae bacterium]
MTPDRRWLIIETSHRRGEVAVAEGDAVLLRQRLDEARRHARDLAPTAQSLLRQLGWSPRDVHGVIVSRGPGSYTGLRVGIMAAKTFAYATGCTLVAIDTFAAIAVQAIGSTAWLDVIADAQQDRIYRQRFRRSQSGAWEPAAPLTIQAAADWLQALPEGLAVSGPGLEEQQARLPPGVEVVAAERWLPRAESLLRLGLARFARGEADDPWRLEPLYLRSSDAEEKWAKK